MKSGSRKAGFTIVETLIVLAITGAMFLSAVIMISGRQAAAQFTQGIRDVEAQIKQTMNEVSSGYYPSAQAVTCTSTGPDGGPVIRGAGNLANTQGSNKDCIFLGRIIQFAVATDANTPTDPQLFNIYTLVGIRTSGEITGVEGLGPAKPRLLALAAGEPAGTPDDMYDSKKLPYGLEVVNMYYGNNPDDTSKKVAAVGFTSSLGNLGGADVSQQVNVMAIPNTRLHTSKPNAVSAVNSNVIGGVLNPDGGLHVCFKSGSTKNSALLSIGGQARQGDVTVKILDSGDCR